MRSRLGLAALLLFLLPLDAPAQAVIESDGAAELGVALRRLGTTKRVLELNPDHPAVEAVITARQENGGKGPTQYSHANRHWLISEFPMVERTGSCPNTCTPMLRA